MRNSSSEPEEDDQYLGEPEDDVSTWRRAPLWLRTLGSIFVLGVLLVSSFEIVYAGKVFPGVTADGVYLGGSSKAAAINLLKSKTADFSGHVVTISNGSTNLRIPVTELKPKYDTAKAADLAFQYGRQGSLMHKVTEQLHALAGRSTDFSVSEYDNDRLVPYIVQMDEDLVTPVVDAGLSFDSDHPQVTPSQGGARLDLGRLTQLVAARIAATSAEPIAAPVYQLDPALDTAALSGVLNKLGGYLAGPLTLTYSGIESTIDPKTIISWIQVGSPPNRNFLVTHDVTDLYPPPSLAKVELSKPAVQKYVADLAGQVDQTAQNAALAMTDGQLTIAAPSRTGVKLNQADAVSDIIAGLGKPAAGRHIALKLETTQADVNENNLDTLGIKEQISEGETYFPGSPSTRLTNVRAGAKRFNGVLLKPGQTFSFGALLGDVGPQTGYVPELVIIGDHEEYQYGGGLCQVSSTAFRAALAAGLPITERVNHAFAISYYTWPYSVPGLDATIYYPIVDFKFVNDTGHYILMQTTMQGVDLKFDFFGTKTKTGVIRGPEFVTGSTDAKQPSHTVFYRDVFDLEGNVTKTDKFDTYYQSSTNFPVTKQFN